VLIWGRNDPPHLNDKTKRLVREAQFYKRSTTRLLDRWNERPSYRPPFWLWLLVIAGFVLAMRALVFGWKGTHP
jgi:hypothetical protein